MDYEKKVKFAINLLQSIPQDDGPIEVSYSGGKDSDVILELAKMAGIPFEAIYKNTTIDPPGTIKHCKDMGVTILKPKKTFLQLVEEMGLPCRFSRFCCGQLKEYKVYNRAIHGIRRCESTARAKRYKEPEMCRLYPKGEKVRVYLPILEWTNEDVARFIKERGIKCAPLYYDEEGNFHPERRLGCICCPLASKATVKEEYKKYPNFLRAEIIALQKRYTAKPNLKNMKRFGNPYNQMFFHIFCENMQEYEMLVGGGQLFDSEVVDAKKFLEDYYGIDLTI